MGFFDFLKGKSTPPPAGAPAAKKGPSDRKIAGLTKVVADKRAQTYDRLEALQALADAKSPDAAAGLLKRFTFSIDPSITDQEEKDLAFTGIVGAGVDAVPAVVEFALKAEQLTWPLKVLRELLEDEDYRGELVDLLGRFDTEYARNVHPKVQIIVALEELVHEEVVEAVEPFLEDVNETVRFHAVQTLFAQNDRRSLPGMVKLLASEESVRVKNKVADALVFRGWEIPTEDRANVVEALRDSAGYRLDRDGKLEKNSLDA